MKQFRGPDVAHGPRFLESLHKRFCPNRTLAQRIRSYSLYKDSIAFESLQK